jgi:hypothetical protein
VKSLTLALLLAVLFSQTACGGKTTADVLAEQRPAFDALRAELARIAAALPPPGSPSVALAEPLAPAPVHDEPPSSNLDVLMFEQLTDPYARRA